MLRTVVFLLFASSAAGLAQDVRRAVPAEQPAGAPSPKATPKVMVALPNYDEETSVRLQIFLDNANFGPGKIDGRMGEFFRKALIAYKRAKGLPLTGAIDQELLAQVPKAYTTFQIPEDALKYVGEVPSEPVDQAKLKAMRYSSLAEYVGERFHVAQEFLRKINPEQNLERIRPGHTVRVPNVRPFEIEKLSEGFREKDPALAKRRVLIDTTERFLEIYEGDQLIAEFPITPGSSSLPAPKGDWIIKGIATMPWFRHDEGMLNHGVRTDDFHNLPPGPNNPVGVLWMGLNKKGIGIHGTNNPETIGRAASHGCIRTANWDAAKVKELVTVETPVTIF